MIYSVHNVSASPRAFYDAQKQEITLKPGTMRLVDLDDGTYTNLSMRQDIIIKPASFERYAPYATPAVNKHALLVTGHFGIGDNLHQRAVMRELMRDHDVWLHTCHAELYHDLIKQGLKLVLRPTNLHAQAKTIAREKELFASFPPPPANARPLNIGYPKVLIDKHGSILETMFGCVGKIMPEQPDFSLPIKPEWKEAVRDKYLNKWDTKGKRLLVHRPIVVRNEWDGRSRNPDLNSYDQLYRTIRDQLFVVSVADLAVGREWIDGPHQEVDVALHNGELTFPEMAALFAEADLVFCNAGFAPVLAQAVGTPVIVVYGGRESYRTTQRVGAHLARTLPIDPINPCDCHSAHHACDKRIDLPKALMAVKEFALGKQNNTLLFGTFYIDSADRSNLTDLWKRLHLTLNGADCDFLAVDSQSPLYKFREWHLYDGVRHHLMYWNFPDNIGHLSRRQTTQGRDGWGRAFCKGLEIACELGYEFVVHIEGDSLLRLKVGDIIKWMRQDQIECVSTPVKGILAPSAAQQWVETGLMFFSTDYLRKSDFIKRYDWPNRKSAPTPERWIRMAILNHCQRLRLMDWRAFRADKQPITKDNIEQLNLDWVTHQHDSAQQGVYEKFVEMALAKEVMQNKPADGNAVAGPKDNAMLQPKEVMLDSRSSQGRADNAMPQLKLNLGCGTNKLAGWENRDADVDITKRLPWPDGSVSHIFIEHCVEHVPYKSAISFFQEAHRVLAPGGVLRVTVPSLEQIAKCDEVDYHQFTTQWQKIGATKRGAMSAIIYAHGHECAWNVQLLKDTLYFSGFDDVLECKPGQSNDPALRGVEGHGKVIGDKFNLIESCTCEARKAGQLIIVPAQAIAEVAIVIGGAECWRQDLAEARRLIGDRSFRYYYINDHIKTFPDPGVAVTLHPDKLNGVEAWLTIRRQAGLIEPEQVWAHRKHTCVTHDTASIEWQGSSGLFAVQVARRNGHRKIIGCGVPMTVDGSHFERHQKWQSAIQFRTGWARCRQDLGCFRSMSGWTAEQFGKPDEEWLRNG